MTRQTSRMPDQAVLETNGKGNRREPPREGSFGSLRDRSAGLLSRTRRGLSVAIVVAFVGMATGATSLYLTWSARSEEAALLLSAYPTASQNDITPQGLGLRVELVNGELRPVVVRSADLLLDGEVVSAASGWVDNVGLLDQAASNPSLLRGALRTFPITLDARAGKEVALMMDVWSPLVGASSTRDETVTRKSFRELTATLATLPIGAESDRLRLRLNHAPGGSDLYALSAVRTPTSSVSVVEAAAALMNSVPPQLWAIDRPEGLAGITIRRRLAGADEIDLVRLDLWNDQSPFHLTFVRPVVARQQTFFPLPDLPRGAYIATFMVKGDVVAYRSFAVQSRR